MQQVFEGRTKDDDCIVAPIQPIKITKIIKSDKSDENKFSVIKLSQPYFGVFLLRFEHKLKINKKKRYPEGQSGVVKRVFAVDSKPDKTAPVCAVKIFKYSLDFISREKGAKNEVKFNSLLKRETVWGIMNEKCYVLVPWLGDINLRKYIRYLKIKARDGATSLTFPILADDNLLKMFENYLEQAKVFHKLNMIIGDPKPENVMMNFTKGTMEMVDFEAVHLVGTCGNGYSCKYLPPNFIVIQNFIVLNATVLHAYSQADDIYVFGLMLAEIFPKYFKVKYKYQQPTKILFTEAGLKTENDGLRNLVLQMTHNEAKQRPSIDDCLKGISGLLQKTPEQPVTDIEEEEEEDEVDEFSLEFSKLEERFKALRPLPVTTHIGGINSDSSAGLFSASYASLKTQQSSLSTSTIETQGTSLTQLDIS